MFILKINFENINKVLEAISPLPEDFGVHNSSSEVEEEWILEEIYERAFQADHYISIKHGISKLVLISPNFGDVVVKIPFNGSFKEETFYSYHSSNSANKYCDTNDWKNCFYPFTGASGRDRSDYCLLEYELYRKMKKASFSCFAVKTIFYTIINEVRIFLQEAATPLEDADKDDLAIVSEKSRKIATKWRDQDVTYMDKEWIAACIEKYGEKKTKKFIQYAEDNFLFCDMHDGNYGYRKGGYPVLIDFCDFCS